MQHLPSPSANRIQIAGDAVTRTTSIGSGADAHQQRLEKPGLSRFDTHEEEAEEETDERDIRKKQVCFHDPTCNNSY